VRLWSVHPKYLDAQGLVALWREALLARAVLSGRTKGYRHHPQLVRFRARPDPVACINAYLKVVYDESRRRGYHFDPAKLRASRVRSKIPVTAGQLDYEWAHLKRKLRRRSPAQHRAVAGTRRPRTHPLFVVRRGEVEKWEGPSNRSRKSERGARNRGA